MESRQFGSASVLNQVEDDLLCLDLAVFDQVQACAWRGDSCPKWTASHCQGEQKQRVVVIASAGDNLHAASHHRLGVGDQALHVVVDASQVDVWEGGIGGGHGDVDVRRQCVARGVEVVVGPRLYLRAGEGDSR